LGQVKGSGDRRETATSPDARAANSEPDSTQDCHEEASLSTGTQIDAAPNSEPDSTQDCHEEASLSTGTQIDAAPRTGIDSTADTGRVPSASRLAGWAKRVNSPGNSILSFGAVIFFSLVTSVFAAQTLDALGNAAAGFAVAIQQQLEVVESDSSPARLAEKTIEYAQAKTAYFTALREEKPKLIDTATGREPRPIQLDKFTAAFAVAGEDQEMVADQKTCFC
jgi:hypothetical protein